MVYIKKETYFNVIKVSKMNATPIIHGIDILMDYNF